MFTRKPSDPSSGVADPTAPSTDTAIQSILRVTNEAIDSLSSAEKNMQHRVAPLLHRVAEKADALAKQSVDAVHSGSQKLRDKTQRVSASTVQYVKEEPVKALLIAAATGAAVRHCSA